MARILDEIQTLFELYPRWLVVICLAIVGIGVGWCVWKLVRVGMVLLVTALLLAIVGFAGWMILGS